MATPNLRSLAGHLPGVSLGTRHPGREIGELPTLWKTGSSRQSDRHDEERTSFPFPKLEHLEAINDAEWRELEASTAQVVEIVADHEFPMLELGKAG